MNKKIVTIFLFVFCVLVVISVSVWGKIPDGGSRISVKEISFVDSSTEDGLCELNEDGEKIIWLERGVSSYKLEYVITPMDATEKDVEFVVISGNANAEVSEDGTVTFINETAITVKIYSNLTDGKTDTVIIEFKGNIVSGGEDNPFA